MQEGLSEIAEMVKATLGPGGLPIIIQRVGQSLNGEPLGPKITKDGVSVAEECGSNDPAKDLIIQAVKHICKKTNTTAGDGTTTAIVLGEAIVIETLKILEEDPSLNPQLVKESIEKAVAEVQVTLKEMAIPISNMETVKQAATISANGDQEIGGIIGDAFEAVGAEGVVTVDEGSTNQVTLNIVDGYQIDRGVEGRTMFFNNKEGTKFEATNCAVICYDGKLLNYTEIANALNTLAKKDNQGRAVELPPVLIIANDFSNEVLTWLGIQKADAGLQLCPIKGPHQTTVRSGYYDDIACMSGGARCGNGKKSLKELTVADAGVVGRVVVDKYKCIMYDGEGDSDVILSRVDRLNAQKLEAESPYDVQVLNDRIGALTGGVAKIGVGGATEFEIKEKYDRIEDALNAARAAIEEGVVPGGGCTLLRIASELNIKNNPSVGDKILSVALTAPFKQILINIGLEATNDIGYKLEENENLVYNARTKEVVNFMEAGIVDPVKVTRLALENATSIASLLSTAGGGIIYVKD
tara:strand:+ start:61316 stop:62890 length:1575 start_codon:yes stop_codon:yes gene_type:complete